MRAVHRPLFVTCFIVILVLLPVVAAASAAAQTVRPPVLNAEAVLLLDTEGKTLYAKNPEAERSPASLVKLMTLYLACEDLDAGRANIDETVTVSVHAAKVAKYRMGLRPGQEVPLQVLLEGVAIASANDAATALAERLSGDESAFVARMNDKAKELGLTGTHYANPHGLPDPSQRSTARDLAELTARLLKECPMSRPLLGGQTFIWNGRVYARHISLFNDPGGGVQAVKTGFTRDAGYNLSVSVWKAGQQFIMVVLGSRTRAMSYRDAKKLLKYAFVETGLEAPVPAKNPPAPRRPLRARRAVTR